MCHFCWAYPGEQAERVVGKEDVAPVPAEHEVVGEEEFAPVQEHEVVDREEVAHVLAEQRFGYEQVRNCSMNRSLSNWRRMVTEFFLREINAHRCMRFNLSRGSTSAMRRLRQEAGDLEEAPAAEIIWITCHDDFLIGKHYLDHLPDAGYTRDVDGEQPFWQSGPRKA